MASLFGWQIVKKEDEKELPSFVEKTDEDGNSTTITSGGSYGQYVDIEGSVKNETELITKYREIAKEAEIEYAIDEIINEAIASDENDVVSVNMDKLEGYSENIKKLISDEFDNIKQLLNINTISYELFRRWYIDGRMYYHVVIDPKNPQLGIQELRYIDPRKIKKVKEVNKKRPTVADGEKAEIVRNEYYVYSEKGFGQKVGSSEVANYNSKGIKISVDSVIQTNSGLMDENNKMTLSYLHKAIRPFNMLRALENSVVIYRISRAPERRIFYIDVGNMPRAKAEQHLADMMRKHKNRLVYDASSGEIRDDRKHMTMLEDYWFPRRDGKSTEITTLPGGQNLGDLSDLDYFIQKLYKSLNIPASRLESGGGGFNIGRPSEISRDELKFQKFIARLRKRFAMLFYSALEKQLVLKNIIAQEEWEYIRNHIFFEFAIDNHFTEMKNLDIMMSRVEAADRYLQYVGTYISPDTIRKKIFMQTDEEMEQIDKENKESGAEPPVPVENPQ